MSDPHSRFRAAWLEEHPPKLSDGAPSWLHWTPEASLLATLGNLKLASFPKKRGQRSVELIKTPADQRVKAKRFSSIRDFASNFSRR
ncbi:hypothetical protein ACFWHR_03870 [Leucobacter sp. NPDC058333]|uniref:hypothetical protein n=1 Tax=Leucobacter sp. NPDC058333 TaxID=3346450 RepID=UPI00365344BC